MTFGSSDTTATFEFTATGDSLNDDDESVLLGFEALPERVSEGTNATTTVGIIDDDDPEVQVSFAQSSYDVAEGDSTTVTVTLDDDPERTVEVPITAANRNGAGDGDYTGAPTTVAFDSGDTVATFTLGAADDDVDDDDESVLLGFGALPERVSKGTDTAEVNLVNDDEARVSVSESSLTVGEGAGGAYEVVLDSEPTAQVTVTVGGHSGSDVSVSPARLAFSAGDWDTEQTVTVTAAEDSDAASDTPVRLTHTVAGGDYQGLIAPGVVVTIVEKDASVLSVSPVSGSEADRELVFTVSISAAAGEQVTVDYTTSDVTARAGIDYMSTSGMLTFSANSTAARTVSVPIIDDTADDDEQDTLTLTLGNAQGASLAGGGSTLAVTGTIGDDDDPAVQVSFEQASYSVDEGESVTVTVRLSADPERRVEVPITATPQGGASDSDYLGAPTTVAFDSGDTSAMFTFTAAGDSVDDDDESVLLGFGDLPTRVSAGTNATATVNINDDDYPAVRVSFARSSYDVDEGESVTVTVRLSADPERRVEVPITAANRGVTSSADYSGAPTIVIFDSPDTAATFTLRAANDTVVDDGDTVVLGFGDLPTRVTVDSPGEATVSITDNTPSVSVSFEQASYSVDEGESVAVTVRLSADPERLVEVPITATDQGGASDSDYSLSHNMLVFTAGQISASLTLGAVDDRVDDDSESVLLGLGDLPARVSAGSNATTTVNITDNDDSVSVVFSDFLLVCLSEMAEGETYECSLSNTADGDRAWPAVGLLHSSGDSDRALVAGGSVDVRFCTVTAAPCAGNLVTGDDIETSNWWWANDLVGYSRFDWSGDASAGQVRSFFVSVVDDGEYEPQEVFYIGVIATESHNISAMYNNKAQITVPRSDSAGSDASLSALGLLAGAEPLDYAFSPATYSYSVEVPYRATELVVAPVAAHNRATVAVGGNPVAAPVGAHRGTAVQALGMGSNVVSVTVTAEDGVTRRSYTVDINRQANTAGDVVEVVSGAFALTCPEAIPEGAQHSCTLRNNSTAVEEWPVVAVIHSSLDQHRATVAAGSGAAGSTDVRLWPDRGSTQDTYNYGHGELFHGGIAADRTLYGYQKFDLSGPAAAGEQRTVYLYAEHNDDGTASSETFYVSMGPDGYSGLSQLVANKAPIILDEQTDANRNTKTQDTNNNTADDSKARDTVGQGAGDDNATEDTTDQDTGNEDTTDQDTGDDNAGDGMAGEGAADVRAESPTVASVSAGETAGSWASVTVALDGQASAETAVHVRHRRSDATGTGGWASVPAPVSAGSAQVALWGLEPSTAYRVEASLDPAFPTSSTRSLTLTTAAGPTMDFASEEFTLPARAHVPVKDENAQRNTTYDRDAQTTNASRYFDVVRVDSEGVAAEDLEFYVEELPDRVPYRFCWRSDTATLGYLTELTEPLCVDLNLEVLSNSGHLVFANVLDPSDGRGYIADPHIADYPAQRMRLSAQDTNSGLKIYREFIVHPTALPVSCDDYPDSNWERYNCLFNGEKTQSPSPTASRAMINALPADLVQRKSNYSLVFSEEFRTNSECENLNAALDDDVWDTDLESCDSKVADTNNKRCLGIERGHYYLSISSICTPLDIRTAGKISFRYGYIEIKYTLRNLTSGSFFHNLAVVLGDPARNRKYSLHNYDIDASGSVEAMNKALSMEVDMFENVPNSRRSVAHQYLNYRPIDATGEVKPHRTTYAYTYCTGGAPNPWYAIYSSPTCRTSFAITIIQGLEWTPRGYRRFIKVQGQHDSFVVISKNKVQVQYQEKKDTSTPNDPVFIDSWSTYYQYNHDKHFEYLDPADTDSILEQVGVTHVPMDIQIVGWGYPTGSDVLNLTKLSIDYIRVFQPEDRYAAMEPVYQ